jgi:cyclophilin family peptidyl-prolyl cis-trans isomerase
MPRLVFPRLRVLVATGVALLLSTALCAEDKGPAAPAKPGAKKTTKKADAEEKGDPAEWKDLVARRKELFKELEALEKQYREADETTRQKLVIKLQKLEAEFRADLQPKIQRTAPLVYEIDPTDVDAAEVMVGRAYQENRYQDVIAMAEKVAGGDKASAPLLTLKGISQFATHDFENARKTLMAARKADKQVFPRLGQPFLEACDDYIEYWKAEQEIRANEAKADDLPRVQFKTNRGNIVIELFENEAPNTVANFISLVESGKYDGVAFHRVIPNFMAQGGDPNTLDDDPTNDGLGGPGYTIACECYAEKARKHFQGTLSMAHAGRDTGGSQFFLTHLPTAHLNYEEGKESSNHTVFGRVVEGLDLALGLKVGDKILSAKVLRKRDHEYQPKTSASKRGPNKKGSKPKTPPAEE